MNVLKKIKKRMENRSGESLVETLASILIISLSAVILATFVMSASKLNQTSQDRLGLYFTEKNANAMRIPPTGFSIGNTVVKIKVGMSESDLGSYDTMVGGPGALSSYWP